MTDYLVLISVKCLGRLPLSVLRVLGVLMGYLLWFANSRAKNTTLINLAICFPELSDTERRYLAKKSLCETMKTALEACAIWTRSWSWLNNKIVAIEGNEILRAKIAEKKALLVVIPHLGNWEVVGPFFANLMPLTALYQPLKKQAMDQLVLAGREKNKMQMAPSNALGVKMLFKALRAGQGLCILPDQVPDRDTGRELTPFFNKPAWTMTLVQGLIQRTGCAVCCCYAERVAGGFKIVVMEANPSIYSDDVKVSVNGLSQSIEACVRRVPVQYQWEYKRFRQLPKEYAVQYDK